jgi:phospholipase C
MKSSTRFAALAAAAALAGALSPLACSKSSDSTPSASTGDDAGGDDASLDVVTPPPIMRTQTEGQLGPQRSACAFKAGAWPAETIGTDYPVGADIPINHVIVIEQENRSFDNYLGRLVAQGYYKDGEVDVPPPGWSNPSGDGGVVVPHPDTEHCFGVNHSWEAMHDDYDNGKLDHFVSQNDPDGQRTFFYEDDTVIPFYYALASTFSIGDRYFCSALTSTWPNRMFMMAATSFGVGDNSFDTLDTAASPSTQVFSELAAAGRSWKDYTDGPHQVLFFPYFGLQKSTEAHYGDIKCDLLGDIQNGTLPDVSLVMGDEVDETSDEGPSALPGIGGQLVEAIIRALFASPSWKDTVVFITYDENGGMADHVPPAKACPPDNLAPHDGKNNPLPGAFDTTGFRVPFIVVSPYARAHFVSHQVYDHTSITRFIEARFGLPAMSGRDANATPPMELFDFKNPPFMTPPNIAAHTTVDPAVLKQCGQSLAPTTCQ